MRRPGGSARKENAETNHKATETAPYDEKG
jgi:hypothetical protein